MCIIFFVIGMGSLHIDVNNLYYFPSDDEGKPYVTAETVIVRNYLFYELV